MNARPFSYLFALLASFALGACESQDTWTGGTLTSPLLDEPAGLTNEASITLRGECEPGATIHVAGGAEPALAEARADGTFEVEVALHPDQLQLLEVRQGFGDLLSAAALVDIEHDGTPPASPEVTWPASPTRRATVTVHGFAEPGATVELSGGFGEPVSAPCGDDGFAFDIDLRPDADNPVELVAIDAAGNISAPATGFVRHDGDTPMEAPAMDPLPGHVATSTVDVSGSADADVDVRVYGPRGEITVRTDADGWFDAEVELEPNTENHVACVAIDPATGEVSARAEATVTHDDLAPEPPILDGAPRTVGTPAVHLRGSAEAKARIRFDGPRGTVEVRADASGRFEADLELALDGPSAFECSTIDAAGNVSAPLDLELSYDAGVTGWIAIDPAPAHTSDDTVRVTGSADAGADITIEGGLSPMSVPCGTDGRFAADVALNADARNELTFRSDAGVEAHLVIEHDATAPSLDLDPVATVTSDTFVRLRGHAEAGATLEIDRDGELTQALCDGTGAFDVDVSLDVGAENRLSVRALDLAGNASATVDLTIDCVMPVVDAPRLTHCPPITNQPSATVHGFADAGAMIEVRGGAMTQTTVADALTGAFAIDVSLDANARNDLELTASVGGARSTVAMCPIEHDDEAPAAPRCDASMFDLPPLLGCLARASVGFDAKATTEPHARVDMVNLETGARTSVIADGSGGIQGSLELCAADALALIAVDAAGNASAETRTFLD